ncbi:MAG: IS3 family transposase [Planctomycetaceae bacterium]
MQAPSPQRYVAQVCEDESELLERIQEPVRTFPRPGYCRITRLLHRGGWEVSFKRVYRLWRQKGLKVPQKKRKRRRLGDSFG